MIDVGFWEVTMIGVLALIILGPERLPGVARTAGVWMGKARRMMNDIKSDIKSELNEADLNELKNIRDDIQQAGDSFKSQIEENEDKLQKDGSAIDTAIADALNKSGAGASIPKEKTAKEKTITDTKKTSKTTKKKNTRKKPAGAKTAREKPSNKKVAKQKASTPDKEKSS
jgi:sec-independent protein translocase protein TatB